MIEVTDAIHRQVRIPAPPRRIVSLVPSETLSVAELSSLDRVVGRTDYCIEPRGVESITSVGGTKGFDVEAVKALRPDLVLANKEENSRPLVNAMVEAGLPVHVSFPCTVAESMAYLEQLCVLLGVDADAAPVLAACRTAVDDANDAVPEDPLPVFVPIWKDPWMTFDGGAFASDILELCGGRNVFSDRPRRYPLAADLGRAEAWSAERVQDRDTRYPRIQLQEVADRGARAALLPNEPYAFAAADAEAFAALDSPHPIEVALVDGKDLFWYGTYVARAVPRLRDELERARNRHVGWQAHE